MATAFVGVISNSDVDASKLEGLLFAACERDWMAWKSGDGLVATKKLEDEERRSKGGILLGVGAMAGDTLNAVGEIVAAQLPESPEELFRRRFQEESEDVDSLARKLEVIAKEREADLNSMFRHVLQLTDKDSPDWLRESPKEAWNTFARVIGGTRGGKLDPGDTHKSIRKTLRGERASSSRTDDTGQETPAHRKFDEWLEDELRDRDDLEPDDINDTALRDIYRGNLGWSKRSITFCQERLDAYLDHREEARRRDFHNLAPLPDLGPSRQPEAPGLPVQDALWAVRALQESFPGRVAASEDAPMRIHSVSLALVSRDEDGNKSPECANQRCYLFGENADGDLRNFGQRLLKRIEGLDVLQKDSTQYYICVEVEPRDRRGRQSEPVDLLFAMPWRWERRALREESARSKALASDKRRFAEAAQALKEIKTGAEQLDEFEDVRAHLVAALEDLQEAWEKYPEVAGNSGFGEETGLHTSLSDDLQWEEARKFIVTYWKAAVQFAHLFEVAGDIAPRIAEGPLDTFLQFGIHRAPKKEEVDQAYRIFGYHPLRLLRLARLEREAFEELVDALGDAGTLRDVPLTHVPSVEDTPLVIPSAHSWDGGEDEGFLVPQETDDPWNQIYIPFQDPKDREPDLVMPLRPILNRLAGACFPAMRRRMTAHLHEKSETDRGIKPLQLCTALTGRATDAGAVSEGVDLVLGNDLEVPATEAKLSSLDEGDELSPVIEAMTELRPDDPRSPLEVTRFGAGERQPSQHIGLLVRPWSKRAKWSVRVAREEQSAVSAMAWDAISQSWSSLKVEEPSEDRPSPGAIEEGELPAYGDLEQVFQELVIRHWRGEADTLPRILGLTLDASGAHGLGQEMLETHLAMADDALRVVIADPVFGAEALDDLNVPADADLQAEDLNVTLADYHRKTGWRVTVIGKHKPARERDAVKRGLSKLYSQEDVSGELADAIYEATHRAAPAVTRHLWGLVDGATEEAELIGHMGVALFASSTRGELSDLGGMPRWMVEGFPEGTVLLSMDSLQKWTWTRRGGTRGDFIAVVPVDDKNRVRIVAIESKGSAKAETYDGREQAATARKKLRERFRGKPGEERRDERRDLLRSLAQEAFRARGNHRQAYNRIATGDGSNLSFEAVCVSTARQGDDFEIDTGKDTVWLKVQGLNGLRQLAGLPERS